MGWEIDENMIELNLDRYKMEQENGKTILSFKKGGKWFNLTSKRTGGFRERNSIEKIMTNTHMRSLGISILDITPTDSPKHGIEKIGDSIRAYVYLVLSSQQAARHGIIGDGAQAAAAQEIFVDNLEDVINKEVSLEDDIARFQNVLKYARSKLDYSVGRGLYMIPSNMLLKPLNQVIEGYNNKIFVNTGRAEQGSLYTRQSLWYTRQRYTRRRYKRQRCILSLHDHVR